MIDSEGFRANVGIVLVNKKGHLFWARRIGQDAWQFPQGGMHEGESIYDTLYRELHEEIGLAKDDVEIIAEAQQWYSYEIPKSMLRHYRKPLCIGQKQKWFLLRLVVAEQKIRLDQCESPEFDSWCWVSSEYPAKHVVEFKRAVYDQVIDEFSPIISKEANR